MLPSSFRRRLFTRPLIPYNSTNANKALHGHSSVSESTTSTRNALLAPVHVPEDPGSVLNSRHPAAPMLRNSSLVIQRRLELGNILFGFEQANKYVVMDPDGNHVGFMAEEETGFTKVLARQWFRTHRAFTARLFDKHENEVLRFQRPFSWINSRIRVLDPINPIMPSPLPPNNERVIGEAQQEWHLWRRKYNLFLNNGSPNSLQSTRNRPDVGETRGFMNQFAYIDEPFLSWDFTLLTEEGKVVGSVNRDFAGLGRELFTDTGIYALRMDAASVAAGPAHLISRTAKSGTYGSGMPRVERVARSKRGMTLDERAVMLATAVGIDFDYFSRHSGSSGLSYLPLDLLDFFHIGVSRDSSSPADSGSDSETKREMPASGVAIGASTSDAGGSGPAQRVDGEDVWTGDPWGARDSPASSSQSWDTSDGGDGGGGWSSGDF